MYPVPVLAFNNKRFPSQSWKEVIAVPLLVKLVIGLGFTTTFTVSVVTKQPRPSTRTIQSNNPRYLLVPKLDVLIETNPLVV